MITYNRITQYALVRSLLFSCVLCAARSLADDDVTAYPDIPRIDVHTHAANDRESIETYLQVRKHLLKKHKCDLALWLNLGKSDDPITDPATVVELSQGRMLCCICDFSSHDGIRFAPDELQKQLDAGFVGFKIWADPPDRAMKKGQKGYPYNDDKALDPTFAKMEEIGMVGASIHIADPCGTFGNRTKWLSDPVEYWRQQMAWRRVLERHPKLKVVNAHGLWAMCQDAPLDYLRHMLSTYPGLNVDLGATFQYYSLVNRDNLRDFMIEYSDRILFATDVGHLKINAAEARAGGYFNCFRILEIDEVVEGGFWGNDIGEKGIKGLKLPREALENIYYRNAMRIYPRVAETVKNLGYAEPKEKDEQ